MEEQADQAQAQLGQGSDPNTPSPPPPPPPERSEPVRSRWTPKPEQILILESIFNSGMVNPPKDETVRIRKLLEKFGSVGDANVFYWFQNRRSRSRRRQRQLQAQAQQASYTAAAAGAINNHQFAADNGYTVPPAVGLPPAVTAGFGSASPSFLVGGSSNSCGGDQSCLLEMPTAHQQMGVHAQIGQSSSMFWPPNGSQNLQFESDSITVFMNGVATAVPRGPIDINAAFGEDVILVHSSGFPLPINDFGCISLQHGETYFLVSRAS